MENKKNIKTFIVVSFIAIFCIVILYIASSTIKPNGDYKVNKDGFNYDVVLNYEKINPERILLGEEIYLEEEVYSSIKNSIPILLIEKINSLSFKDLALSVPSVSYDKKHSSKENSKYYEVKSLLINEYIKENLQDKKYLNVAKTVNLGSKKDFNYIKEYVFFIDTENFTVSGAIELNMKYNHKQDKLEYANYKKTEDKAIEEINLLKSNAMSIYEKINSKKKDIAKDIYNKYKFEPKTIYIYGEDTLLISSDEKTIEYKM